MPGYWRHANSWFRGDSVDAKPAFSHGMRLRRIWMPFVKRNPMHPCHWFPAPHGTFRQTSNCQQSNCPRRHRPRTGLRLGDAYPSSPCRRHTATRIADHPHLLPLQEPNGRRTQQVPSVTCPLGRPPRRYEATRPWLTRLFVAFPELSVGCFGHVGAEINSNPANQAAWTRTVAS